MEQTTKSKHYYISTKPNKKGEPVLSVTDAYGRHVQITLRKQHAMDLGVELAKYGAVIEGTNDTRR